MSFDSVLWVFRHSQLKLASRLVHLAIADSVSEDHQWLLFGGDALLAQKANVDEKTVRRAKVEMIERGYLTDLKRKHPETGRNVYRFEFPRVDKLSSDQPDIFGGSTGQKASSDRTNPDPLLLSTQEHKNTNVREIETDFEEWWQLYPPRPEGNPKGSALKAYRARRAEGATKDDLLSAVRAYRSQRTAPTASPSQYTKQAQFFINKDGFWKSLLTATTRNRGSECSVCEQQCKPGACSLTPAWTDRCPQLV